jgi:hypothetical protein
LINPCLPFRRTHRARSAAAAEPKREGWGSVFLAGLAVEGGVGGCGFRRRSWCNGSWCGCVGARAACPVCSCKASLG